MADLLKALASDGESDSSKSFFSFLSDKAVKCGTPLRGTFELTPRCTLDCAMCYVHLKPEQMHRPELTTEQWLDLIDQACAAGMLFATITGGECMLHPGFKTICEALFDRGIIVSILTNGTLIDEAMVEWLARYSVECVQVTVYGSSPKGYAAVTGRAEAFYQVDRALSLLKEAGLRFTTPITISKQLAPDLLNIVNYCRAKESLKINLSPNPFHARPETGRQMVDYCLSLDEEVDLFKGYYDMRGVSYESCAVNDDIPEAFDGTPHGGLACAAGRSSFALSWDGWMMPCNTLYWMKANPLRDGFEKAWLDTRGAAIAFEYPDKCARCGLRSACSPCPISHYDTQLRRIALNDDVCEETRRLVSEGIRKIP